MRHGNKNNALGRKKAHRDSMLSNMACSLIEHKRIETTLAKAKALRIFVEPLITKSKEDSTHSRRTVFSYLRSKEATTTLFRDVAPKVADRPGGYTRIIKLGNRLGDAAERAMIEMVDFNTTYSPKEKAGAEVKRTRRSRTKASTAKAGAAKTEAKTTAAEAKVEPAKDGEAAKETAAPAEPPAASAAPVVRLLVDGERVIFNLGRRVYVLDAAKLKPVLAIDLEEPASCLAVAGELLLVGRASGKLVLYQRGEAGYQSVAVADLAAQQKTEPPAGATAEKGNSKATEAAMQNAPEPSPAKPKDAPPAT